MEESWQLLWQAQWGKLILVPLQHAHLLPTRHPHPPRVTTIALSQLVTTGINKD